MSREDLPSVDDFAEDNSNLPSVDDFIVEEVEEEYLQGLSNVASGNFRSLSSEEKDKFCKRMLRLSVLLSANKEAV